MANRTTWKPGESGNPKGRPPKGRALTEKVAAAANSTVMGINGEQVTLRDTLARMLWEAALTGQVTFAALELGGETRTIFLDTHDWLDITKNLITLVDGPARIPVDVDHKSNGKEILTADAMAAASVQAAERLAQWEKAKFGSQAEEGSR